MSVIILQRMEPLAQQVHNYEQYKVTRVALEGGQCDPE